ncbi:hypothetical protein [Streptomyces mutabilis]|uniref:hypothetical protein n=1 Tax=Streptomyces mutabilis TaxID=67332 RepID=UPI0036A7E505
MDSASLNFGMRELRAQSMWFAVAARTSWGRKAMPTMLYYPEIEPPRSALYQGLLYWDGVASLIPDYPDGRRFEIPDPLKRLQDRGLYRAVPIEARYKDFMRRQVLGEFPALADALIALSGTRWPERDWVIINGGKFERSLVDTLDYLGLVDAGSFPLDPLIPDSVAMRREVATLLFAAMAQEVARSNVRLAYTPYTVHHCHEEASLGCDPGDGVPAWRVQLGKLLPSPSPDISIDQILTFREQYGDERERLIQATQRMIAELRLHWEHPADVIRSMELELARARRDYVAAGKSRRIAWVERSLAVTVAVSTAAVGALIVPDLAWVSGILGSIGFNIATREIRPLREGQRNNPFSYLHYVDKELSHS